MKCKTPHCRNTAEIASKKCSKCKKREYRAKHPMRTAFQNLRSNAKRRGKAFELTYNEFKEFCIECDYINNRGRKSSSYHIDRIDPSKGYTKDNIQVLTNAQNVKKYFEYDISQNLFRYQTAVEFINQPYQTPF